MKKKLVIGLGSNLGNRYAYIKKAVWAIEQALGQQGDEAQYYTTEPWGDANQPGFINTAILLHSDQDVSDILDILQKIEVDLGKASIRKWGPRCIDLDILFYGDDVVDTRDIQIPHPHLHERAFVLQPLCDLVPQFMHPVLLKSCQVLLGKVPNDTGLFVK